MSSLLRINVFKVDVPREGGRGWKRTSAEVTSNELGEDLLKEVSKGADYVYRETWVPLVLLLSTTPASVPLIFSFSAYASWFSGEGVRPAL